MSVLRSFCLAFAMYSRIPMPVGSDWKEEDGRYAIAFFPLVGAVIGGLILLWLRVWQAAARVEPAVGRAVLAPVLITCAIPLIVTGGIHLDGFLDTSDARSSYGDRDQKLKILKDPHIGAFAVIRTLILCAVFTAAVDVILSASAVGVFCLSFILARVLSGLAALKFPGAGGKGMLRSLRETSQKAERIDTVILCAEGAAAAAAMCLADPVCGAVTVVTALAVMGLYYRTAMREFGGITGDLEGWFLCRCETAMAVTAAVICILR